MGRPFVCPFVRPPRPLLRFVVGRSVRPRREASDGAGFPLSCSSPALSCSSLSVWRFRWHCLPLQRNPKRTAGVVPSNSNRIAGTSKSWKCGGERFLKRITPPLFFIPSTFNVCFITTSKTMKPSKTTETLTTQGRTFKLVKGRPSNDCYMACHLCVFQNNEFGLRTEACSYSVISEICTRSKGSYWAPCSEADLLNLGMAQNTPTEGRNEEEGKQ